MSAKRKALRAAERAALQKSGAEWGETSGAVPWKIALACRLRLQACVPYRWLAAHLRLGNAPKFIMNGPIAFASYPFSTSAIVTSRPICSERLPASSAAISSTSSSTGTDSRPVRRRSRNCSSRYE